MQNCIAIHPEAIFTSAYKDLMKPLIRFAHHFLKDEEEAKDIVSEVFITIWGNGSSFNSVGEMRSFAYVCTRNACYNRLKSIKRRKEKLDEVAESTKLGMANESCCSAEATNYALIQAVATLNEKYRAIVWFYYYEGKTCDEISKALEISIPAVRYRLRKGREMVKSVTMNNY